MTEMTFVRLTEEARSDMAKTIAHTWTRIEELRAKKARDGKKTQDEIDEELEEIGRICRLINDDGQPRDQMELFAGEGDSRVTEDAAKAALAAVMARQPECTPITARECPMHGTCSCERLEDEVEGEAPAVASPDCVLHGVNAPHVTEPPAAAEPTEPEIAEKLATEAVAEWAQLKKTPDSVLELNARIKESVAAAKIPVHRRKPFREAVKRLLSDVPAIPAGAGATDTPPVEEVDGNVAEADA